MKTTFVNQNSENNIIESGEKYLESRITDFKAFMRAKDLEKVKIEGDTQSFYEYGLSFDYVELGTFDDQDEDYFRYQLSWGGPSDEFRFYEDGSIIYCYMDWFSGVGFDVTGEDYAQWIKDWFKGADMMNFAEKREETNYYETLYERENDEEETDEEE